ncbi:MAG: glycosyltransferase family 39 protein [candidate division KSB1 bacterium]|nr:glycosyltransferase family 39 protein [candidate division KSB1 bacterium]MDZ7366486.1 glycosyltransferase family 39 protein [candidate division KSB1 bacterium]
MIADRKKLIILGLVALALLFRLFLMPYRFAVGWDEPHYLQMAASFAAGNWSGFFHPYWSPGLPLWMGLANLLIPDVELAGRLTTMLLGSLIVAPIYLLAHALCGKHVAFWAGVFAALHPSLAFAQTAPLAEPAYMFFGFLGLWLGWQALQKSRWGFAIAAGLCWGFSYLAKPEGTGFLLVFAAFAIGRAVADFFSHRRAPSLLAIAAAGIGFLVAASPYLIYLHKQAGHWTLSAKGAANQQFEATFFTAENDDFFESLSPDNKTLPVDAIFHTGTFLQQAKKNEVPKVEISAGLIARKYATNFFRVLKYGLPQMLSLLLIVLFGLGLLAAPWQREETPLAVYLLAVLIFYWLVMVPFFHITERYLMAMLPLAGIWIARGLLGLAEWLNGTMHAVFSRAFSQRQTITLAVLSLAFLFWLPEMGKVTAQRPEGFGEWGDAVELKEAGKWLRHNAEQQPPIVMSYNKAVDFYAGNYDVRSGVSFSRDSLPRQIEYARHRQARYVVVSERYLKLFPVWQQALEAPNSELKLLYKTGNTIAPKAYVFEIVPQPVENAGN